MSTRILPEWLPKAEAEDRRAFLAGSVSSLAAYHMAEAQQAGKVYHVAVISGYCLSPKAPANSTPVEEGLVASLAHPGGNVSGLADDTGSEIHGKRLTLLKKIAPHISRVAFVGTKGVWAPRGRNTWSPRRSPWG
jgi:hypothetical protein